MKRVLPALTALAVAAALPVVATPAQATPTSTPESVFGKPSARPDDNRLHPLAERRVDLRQTAVDQLASKDARTVGKGANRAIRLADGTRVDYPVTDTAQLLTFLIEFGGTGGTAETQGPAAGEIDEPDETDNSTYWKPSFDRQHFLDMFFNGMDDQDGESFRSLYEEMSSGRFHVEGDVSDWVQVDRPEAYYGENDPDGYEYSDRMAEFIGDGAEAWYAEQVAGSSESEVKDYLADFDTWDRYDADGDGEYDEPDGYIDHFQAIHAGEGEEAGAEPWTIWSHRSGASYWTNTGPDACPSNACQHQGGVEIGDSGYYILDYTTEPENGGLGVFAHEFGHDLGLPDYYDTTSVSPDNGTGFWNLMSSGSWMSQEGAPTGTTPNHMGATEKYFLGWYGPDDLAEVSGTTEDAQTVTLGPSVHATSTGKQAVLVTLPEATRVIDGPFPSGADDDYLYFGKSALTSATATTELTVPEVSPELDARVAYEIESDYDYAYLEASADGGETWSPLETNRSTSTNPQNANEGFGITGSSSGAWVDLTASLTEYAGETIGLRWRYRTDPATTLTGFGVDSVHVGGYTTEFSPNDWDLEHVSAVTDGEFSVTYDHYYLAENRQYDGYDTTLEHGPYSPTFDGTRPDEVQHFPYQDGLLVWYSNGFYTDNDTAQHPGGGANLPVDSSPENLVWTAGGTPVQIGEGRVQAYDATFDVDAIDPLALEAMGGAAVLETEPRPSVPVFEDTDPEAYLSSVEGDTGYRFTTMVGGAGAMVQVLSSDEETGKMVVKIGARFVAATSEPEIEGDSSFGDTLTAVPPTWFQDDVTTETLWLRDGTPIEGADEAEYEITAADIGHTVSARVTGSKAGYQDTAVVTPGIQALADPAPEPSTDPGITGTTQVGQTLTAHAAEWPVDGSSTFAWSRNGSALTNGPTYVVTPDDLGQAITLTETFSSPGYEDATATVDSAVVTKGTAPHATAGPSITGTAQVGQTLNAANARWPVAGESTSAWSVAGTPVGTGEIYLVKPADAGKTITLTQTFSSPGYDVATSAVTSAAVIPGKAPVATTRPTVSGPVRFGSTLKAVPGTWPLAGTSTLAWSIGGQTVGTGTTYVVRAADVGKPFKLTETLTSPGYENGKASTDSQTVAKAPVSLSVATKKAKKGKKVAVTVTAKSGRLKVSGKVTVTYAGKKVRSPVLKNGKLTVKLPAKQKGDYWLVVSYAGSSAFAKASKTIKVKVK